MNRADRRSRRSKHADINAVSDEIDQRSIMLLLATISGACGLAYEVIYLRVFSAVFGGGYAMNAILLASVFVGIAIGAWFSGRLLRHLAPIEFFVGVFSLALAALFHIYGFSLATLPVMGPLITAAKILALLLTPMVLIGACLPLFSGFVEAAVEGRRQSSFAATYALYNAGAATSLLLIEFLALRLAGITATLCILAVLNFVVAFFVWRQNRADAPAAPPTYDSYLVPTIVVFLALFSFASGVFQLYVIRFSHFVFGPIQENFSIILLSAILGISIGATWVRKVATSPAGLAILAAIAALIVFLITPLMLYLWSGVAGGDPSKAMAFKIALLVLYPLPVFVVVGAAVPIALSAHQKGGFAVAGKLLAIASLANGAGALVMGFVLYRILELPQIAICVAALFLLAAAVSIGGRVKWTEVIGGGVVAAPLLFCGVMLWPERELLLGYRTIADHERLQDRMAAFDRSVSFRDRDQQAGIVWFKDGTHILTFNGYRSLTFFEGSKSPLREMIVGATPALFSKETKSALVLGLGSGITAGSTASVFDETLVLEINPAIAQLVPYFERHNAGIETNPSAEIRIDDGLVALLSSEKTYDAIINTVTSPRYYASANLYTAEFFALVKARLAKGGVYSGWFDINIGDEGIAVLMNTLEAVFGQCRYLRLADGYFNLVCGDGPLLYQSSRIANERVLGTVLEASIAESGFDYGFASLGRSLEISFKTEQYRALTDRINLLDRPAFYGH